MKVPHPLKQLFDWKNKPSSVFLVATPLALLGFGIVLLNGILQYKHKGDPVVLIIWGVGIVLLTIALIPAWRIYKMTHQTRKKEH